MRLSLATAAEWAEGSTLNNDPPVEVTGVNTDSRTVRPGDLFVALEGPRFDGHDYIAEARERGAAAALVRSAENLGDMPGIIVPDPLTALGQMAHRQRWCEPLIPWIGITGSNGKTTTREILAHILRIRGPVVTPKRNFNNLIGLPLTLLKRSEKAWAGVLELGTNRPGEIPRLTQIAMPTASIVTSVGPAHLEGFGSLEAVAEEKGSIYDLLPDDGLAILPQQDPFTPTLQRHIHKRKVTYAVGWPADLTAEQVEATAEGSRFRARGVEVFLPLAGVHNVSNCLAAMLAAEYLGIGIEEAAAAVADMSPVHDRLERIVTPHLVVLDDAYNANPGSLRAAAETLALFDAPRRIAIVGDMLELGEHSRALHKDAGRFLTTLEIDIILAVGPKSVALAEAASTASVRGTVRHYKTVAALLRQLPEFLTPGDLVLVKGSRGMKMERVVQALKRWSPSEAE